MRYLAVITLLLATPALADPKADTLALHGVVLKAGAAFIDLVAVADSDPARAAAAIDADVKRPVSAADVAWMGALVDAPDAYGAFLPCRQAAVTLESLASDFVSFLGGGERPDISTGVENFRIDLSTCETILGLPVTFAAGAG